MIIIMFRGACKGCYFLMFCGGKLETNPKEIKAMTIMIMIYDNDGDDDNSNNDR